MLTMTVPGLLGRDAHAFATTRAARALSRYVDSSTQEREGIGSALCVALSLERRTPVAALRALGAGLDVDDRYIIEATPVTLVADRDAVVLLGAVDDLQADEAATLIELLNRHFHGDGVAFAAPHPSSWFAQCERAFEFSTSPMEPAINRPIARFLPEGRDANMWQRWQVEIQMLFHEHAVNESRAARGLKSVSGVWLSGNGRLSEGTHPTLHRVFGSSDSCGDLARGLARKAGLSADALPSSFSRIMGDLGNPILIAMNPIASESDLSRFAVDWLEPAIDALASRRLDELQLIADGHGAAVTWHAKRPSGLRRIALPLKRRGLEIPVIAQE